MLKTALPLPPVLKLGDPLRAEFMDRYHAFRLKCLDRSEVRLYLGGVEPTRGTPRLIVVGAGGNSGNN